MEAVKRSFLVFFLVPALLTMGMPVHVAFANNAYETAETEANQILGELSDALVNTEKLTWSNAGKIQKSFDSAFGFIDKTMKDNHFTSPQKVKLVTPVVEKIGESYGDLASPFVDVTLPMNKVRERYSYRRDTRFNRFMEKLKVGASFVADQMNFWVFSWATQFGKDGDKVETPLESYFRGRIGKKVFRSMRESMTFMNQALAEEAEEGFDDFDKNEVISLYARIVEEGLASEPARYHQFSKKAMMGWLAICIYHILAPRWMHPIPVDIFMEPTWSSYLFGRALFIPYAFFGVSATWLLTAYGLGDEIEESRLQLKEMVEGHREEYTSLMNQHEFLSHEITKPKPLTKYARDGLSAIKNKVWKRKGKDCQDSLTD